MKCSWRWLLLVPVLALCLCGGYVCCHRGELPDPPVPPMPRQLHGGTDVTFLVAADTHFGFAGMEAANQRQIDTMNTLAGKPWPQAIGGAIAEPKALLIAGDLTEWGSRSEWNDFARFYGFKGGDGKLRYPVLVGTGNHDRLSPFKPILDRVRQRHGTLVYSWDWGDLHLVCLDEYPDEILRRWLAKDLAAAGPKTPVILFQHFPLAGPYADFWPAADKDAFAETIRGYNVIAIFHGHYHASVHYRWHGIDVYNTGAPRHGQNTFLVARLTDTHLVVASWRWDQERWMWWHSKPINGRQPAEPERSSGPVPNW